MHRNGNGKGYGHGNGHHSNGSNGNGNGHSNGSNGNGNSVGRSRGRGQGNMADVMGRGRARGVEVEEAAESGVVSERGATRGRRIMPDLIYTRPQAVVASKKGTTGAKILIITNYFRIHKKDNWTIYRYHIDFAPTIEVTRIRKAIFYASCKQMFQGCIFDGMVLLTSTRLPKDITEVSTKRHDESDIKLTIKFVGKVDMQDQSSLQVLNNIMRACMEGLKLQLVGRNFFDALAKIPIRTYHLELWPGYITSIRQHEQDVLMCAEITTKTMRMQTLLDILSECANSVRDYKEAFARTVVGSTVLTDYSNKTYRIDDVDWDQSPMSTFETKNGQVTYSEYYKKRYNINIRDMKQPLLLSTSKDRNRRGGQPELIALVPELCRATGLTEDMRRNFPLMKALAEHTRVGPGNRITRLKQFNERLRNTPDSMRLLTEWEMNLDRNLVEVQARELPFEPIVFADGREVAGTIDADWTRDFRNNKLFTVVELRNWHVVVPRRADRETRDFVRVLQDAVRSMGMIIRDPKPINVDSDRVEDILRGIDVACNEDTQLVMVIVSNNNAARYASIKKRCCVDRAVPSQVMVQKTITPKGGNVRGLMSVATKVAIQLNCKLGAVPWFIKLPLTGLMVVGYDVSRDTKQKTQSFGALVASMDMRESTAYYSTVSPHRDQNELSNDLALNFTKALKEYRNTHGRLPSKIIFYRDGVGDGQLHYVVDLELKNLIPVLEKIYEQVNEKLRFAFVVVNKRLNTRLFKGDRNPQPGTVVDDVITLPERYDFFIVSQSVRQGTVSPTSYNVIYDTVGLPPDKMQIITYKMCHLYYNWSGTTRVPAVCQYAHKLSFLVAQHIHTPPSQNLQNQLYFL